MPHNISSEGNTFDHLYTNYVYKFKSQHPLLEVNDIMGMDIRDAVKRNLLLEFELSLNTALYGDPAGSAWAKGETCPAEEKLNDEATVHNIYETRLLESIKNDRNLWTVKSYSEWSEYLSPKYKNKEGKTVQFSYTYRGIGAYVNGTWLWDLKSSFLNKRRKLIKRELRNLCNFLLNRELEIQTNTLLSAI